MIIISIGVIVKTAIDNKKDIKSDNIEETTMSQGKENTEDEISSKLEGNSADSTISSQTVEEKEEMLAKEEVDTREEELYSKVFETFHSGEYAKAIDGAEAIISKYPNSYKGYNIRGIAKAYNGNFEEGMKDIDKALQIKPDYGYALFNKALNYELNGYYDEAIRWYDEALKVEQYLWSYYGKASIYGRKGDISNVVDNLNKALALTKDSQERKDVQEAARNESDFDPIKNTKEFQDIINN